MQGQSRGRLPVNFPQELQEFLMPVTGHAFPDHGSVQQVQSGEQGCGAVPLVVVRHRAAAPFLQRQARLGAIQGLDLTLLIKAQHQGLVRRVQLQAHHIGQFLDEAFVAEDCRGRAGTSRSGEAANREHPGCCTVAGLTPWAAAMVRTLRCVAATGWLCRVASTICWTFPAGILLLRPRPAWSSVNAAGPPLRNRCRHRITVGRLVFSSRAIFRFGCPLAASSTIRDRKTTFYGLLRALIQVSKVRLCAALTGNGSGTLHMVHPVWERFAELSSYL